MGRRVICIVVKVGEAEGANTYLLPLESCMANIPSDDQR